jgi:hypothetical protein
VERQASAATTQEVERAADSSILGGRKARLVESRREPLGGPKLFHRSCLSE